MTTKVDNTTPAAASNVTVITPQQKPAGSQSKNWDWEDLKHRLVSFVEYYTVTMIGTIIGIDINLAYY